MLAMVAEYGAITSKAVTARNFATVRFAPELHIACRLHILAQTKRTPRSRSDKMLVANV